MQEEVSTSPQGPRTAVRGLGILLIQLGTPDAPTPAALKPYLRQFLSDPRRIRVRIEPGRKLGRQDVAGHMGHQVKGRAENRFVLAQQDGSRNGHRSAVVAERAHHAVLAGYVER